MSEALVRIGIVVSENAARPVVTEVRRWYHAPDEPRWRDSVACVDDLGVGDIARGLRFLSDNPNDGVLIACGMKARALQAQVLTRSSDNRSIIVDRPPSGFSGDVASASAFAEGPFLAEGSLIRALKKVIVRKTVMSSFEIRELTTMDELREYLALRYSVWKRLRIRPPLNMCDECRWEVDRHDRHAVAIGAFTLAGTLVGCGRLVIGTGPGRFENGQMSKLIRSSEDTCVRSAFEHSNWPEHPLDVLDLFPGFQNDFRRQVTGQLTCGEVGRIVVEPSFRERGLGEALLDSLISIAQDRRVGLLVLACRSRHHRFYERSGFALHSAEVRRDALEPSLNAVLMVRELNRHR